MDSQNDSIGDVRMKKRVGTREEVFKGLASRTAGGLKKDDIIAKQFGTRTLYISKRLSDRMRENFQNANYFRKRIRKTLVATNNQHIPDSNGNGNGNTLLTNPAGLGNTLLTNPAGLGNTKNELKLASTEVVKAPAHHGKTQKLSFKVNDNTFKNVYYKELQGMNLLKLKNELKQEEAEEDLGAPAVQECSGSREFKIEDVPEISLDDLE